MTKNETDLIEDEQREILHETAPRPRHHPAPVKPHPSAVEKYFFLATFVAAVSAITVLVIAADECRQCFQKAAEDEPAPATSSGPRKSFRAYGRTPDVAHLREVFAVLERLGYRRSGDNGSDWDLLWAHDYPFSRLYDELADLKDHQRVNHFPGCGHITNKVSLATSGLPFIPPAFKLPVDKEKLLGYAKRHPNVTFVQKNNDHRHVTIKNPSEINLDEEGTFLQEYVDKPLLVNGHRFDIGIYAVITSVEPLRLYIYNGEGLLRFCPVKYHPFDPKIVDKYVVGDDYLPVWEVPAFDYYYNTLGLGMRDTLDAYLRSQSRDPAVIWQQTEEAIRGVVLAKESQIVEALKRFKSKRNFFELVRFDFVIDENLKVYLLEANMSPNLSSAHFRPNKLLYQQVLYNVLGLVGIGENIYRNSLAVRSKSEEDMIASDKTIAVFPDICNSNACRSSCMSLECQLCKNCLAPETRAVLVEAAKEHFRRGDCKRLFPPLMTQEQVYKGINIETYSPENQLLYRWFQGKCLLDASWC
ncbi:unnamed protein product [Phyllotreta striolata]|uniref:Uncharacterized protein n=1 Tax=Phyllotreta striolata TaxID=444603 RepID=A0A9P0DKJ6_PHYSR|nr:unnamed protein product [Phyllotreta striolata]